MEKKTYRRKGIVKSLIAFPEEWLKLQDVRTVKILTGICNEPAKIQENIQFFGRTYFDYQSAPENETFTDNGYFYADKYPGEFPLSTS